MKAWKFDLWIAMAALIVSALTASAALYQSKVFSDQLSASVWPYVSFERTVTGNASLELRIQNDGAGPAIIEGAELRLDGKPVTGPATQLLARALGYHPSVGSTSTTGDLGPGDVIRAGDSKVLFAVHDPAFAKLAGDVIRRTSVSVYYCSILHKCWVATLSGMQRANPRDIDMRSIPASEIRWGIAGRAR